MAWLLLGNGTSECYYFHENCFLVGTLGKACLQGSDLLVQQHFRWVQLRWDCEPIQGLLQRFLRRKVMNKVTNRSCHLPRWEGECLPVAQARILYDHHRAERDQRMWTSQQPLHRAKDKNMRMGSQFHYQRMHVEIVMFGDNIMYKKQVNSFYWCYQWFSRNLTKL